MIIRLNGLVLSLLATVLVISAAHATPPVIEPAPFFDYTDTTTCAFPVLTDYTTNGQTAKIFSNGTIIITGPLVATYSGNGKSVSLNIAGPATISPSGAVSAHGVGAGPILLPNGEITIGYAAGQVYVDFNIGAVVILHGHLLLDICAALAS